MPNWENILIIGKCCTFSPVPSVITNPVTGLPVKLFMAINRRVKDWRIYYAIKFFFSNINLYRPILCIKGSAESDYDLIQIYSPAEIVHSPGIRKGRNWRTGNLCTREAWIRIDQALKTHVISGQCCGWNFVHRQVSELIWFFKTGWEKYGNTYTISVWCA